MPDTRVVVIAADPLARAGLATLLSGQSGCLVVAQSADDVDFQQLLDIYRPDIALWDLGVNSASTFEWFALAMKTGIQAVVLAASETDAAQAWGAGARGIIARDAAADQIAGAIMGVSKGLVVTSPSLAASLFPSRPTASPAAYEQLTPREEQVLQLLAEGRPNKEIARRLGISEHTVKFHVNSILGKLHAQSRTEAVVLATRSGLVML